MNRIPRHRAWKLELTTPYKGLTEYEINYLKAFNSLEVFSDFSKLPTSYEEVLGVELTQNEKRALWRRDKEAERCILNVSVSEVIKEHSKKSKNPTPKSVATTQRYLMFLDSKGLLDLDSIYDEHTIIDLEGR